MRFRPARDVVATVICGAAILCAAGCAAAATTGAARPRPTSPAVPTSGVFSQVPGVNPVLTLAGGAMYLSWDLPQDSRGAPRMVLARIDARTGAVAATNTFSPGFVGAPLSADGSLWVTDSTAFGELLLRLNPATLMVTGELRTSASQYPEGSHAAYAGGWLWVDGGGQLLRVSPATVMATAVRPLPGAYWSDVAANANGSVLVVSVQGRTGAVQRRDPDTGALLAAHPVGGTGAAAIDGFAGSGVWITEVTGMSAYAEQLSAATMTPRGTRPIAAPADLSVRVADGLLWVTGYEAGGPARNYCADPGTGRRLAPLPVTSLSQGALLAVSGGLLYYAESARAGASSRIAAVPIPAGCG